MKASSYTQSSNTDICILVPELRLIFGCSESFANMMNDLLFHPSVTIFPGKGSFISYNVGRVVRKGSQSTSEEIKWMIVYMGFIYWCFIDPIITYTFFFFFLSPKTQLTGLTTEWHIFCPIALVGEPVNKVKWPRARCIRHGWVIFLSIIEKKSEVNSFCWNFL